MTMTSTCRAEGKPAAVPDPRTSCTYHNVIDHRLRGCVIRDCTACSGFELHARADPPSRARPGCLRCEARR
jgi:hypothetical protein